MAMTPLERFSHPIIGFMGLIESDNWIDVRLVSELSMAHSEWNFVFIGPSLLNMTYFRRIKNLHFLGPIPYPDLPPYVWSFDVGIIPFLINDLTLACNPIKLIEYFCAGKPVVSTAIPEVMRIGQLVNIAMATGEFAEAISKALANHDEKSRQERMETTKKFAWLNLLEEQSSRILTAEANREKKEISRGFPKMDASIGELDNQRAGLRRR